MTKHFFGIDCCLISNSFTSIESKWKQPAAFFFFYGVSPQPFPPFLALLAPPSVEAEAEEAEEGEEGEEDRATQPQVPVALRSAPADEEEEDECKLTL